MRTFRSIKNILVSLALGAILIIANFVTQKFFIDSLGVELLGLNGLFTNIISMLSVAELGFEAAVVYHMYKPLHDKNQAMIASLMHFYKISYRVIAGIIAVAALLLAPFIPAIAGYPTIPVNIYIVYGLFVANSVISYLISYKRSILYADQKSYIVNIVRMSTMILFNIVKVIVLLATNDYYLFLLLSIAITLAENVSISLIVNKSYHLSATPERLDPSIKQDVFKKIKGLLFHKVASFVVKGTDNIIISITLGLQVLGMYSNYQLILTAIQSMFGQISTAIRASIGNLLVDVGGERSFTAFRRLQFANQVLAIVSVSVFFVASDSLVSLWLGKNYILDIWVLLALSLNLYSFLVRSVFGNFKEAAGIFYEDRFVPIVESVINLVASFALVYICGLAGVFIGTTLSSLALHCYSYPKFIYKGLFRKSYHEYTRHMLSNLLVACCAIGAAFVISRLLPVGSGWLRLGYDVLVAIVAPLVVLWLVYRKSDELIYFAQLCTKLMHRMRHRA